MKIKSTFFSFLLFLLFVPISLNAVDAPVMYTDASILIDGDSGSILFADNEHEQLGLASITKIMTVYVFLEEAKEQGIALDDVFYISERVAYISSYGIASGASGVGIVEGQEFTVSELLDLALVYSDNAIAIELAEIASGTEEEHVNKMNEQAKEWNLNETHFYNASGLTMVDYGEEMVLGTKSTDYNVSSAADVAAMSYNIVKEYPEILSITSQEYITYVAPWAEYELKNYNLMLPGFLYEYDNVIGLKTGSSIEAGKCFTAYYDDGENSYIAVVLGAEDEADRFNETAKILDYGKKIELQNIVSETDVIDVDVDGDNKGVISLHPSKDFKISTSQVIQVQLDQVIYNESYFENNRLISDIPIGETVYTLKFKVLNGESIGYSDGDIDYINIDLISDAVIKQQGLIGQSLEKTKDFFIELKNRMF